MTISDQSNALLEKGTFILPSQSDYDKMMADAEKTLPGNCQAESPFLFAPAQ